MLFTFETPTLSEELKALFPKVVNKGQNDILTIIPIPSEIKTAL